MFFMKEVRCRRMAVLVLACVAGVVGVAVGPHAAGAQNPPLPQVGGTAAQQAQQAQQLLQSRPDLVEQFRQRISASGLSSEQLRSRLRAEGYSESLLDVYLPGGTVGARQPLPGSDVLEAMRILGISDSTDVEALRASINQSLLEDRTQRMGAGAGRPVADTIKKPASEQIFGLSVFRSLTSEFLPNVDGPVDAGYKIGPGDRLVLILTGDVELNYTLDIAREGFITIPDVGQLSVATLTLGQLESLLYTRLGRVYSGVKRGPTATTHFSVSVVKLRSNLVYVIGDVERPAGYRVSSAGTAMNALYAAGGPSEKGSLRAIAIKRGNATVATLDLYDYLLRGDAANDVRLESGDVVFVPVHGPHIRVTGEITRPATYELKDGETLADLVRSAGGFTATAGLQRIQIARVTPPAQRQGSGQERVLLDVSSTDLSRGNVPALRLEAGDVVTVFSVASRVRSRIAVKGDVWVPGPQGFMDGLMLSEALRRAGGAKPDAYLGQVLISRLQPDSSRSQLRAVLRDTTGAVLGTDMVLRDDDEIQVFSRTEFRPARYVAISGAVRKPGQYPYREGMTMRDLVLLAGGIEERAYLKEVEIARIPENREGGTTARTLRTPLDSSYLFERSADGRYLGPPGLPAPSGPAPEVILQAYDNVLILQQPDWRLLRTVVITGEVKYAGRYTIQNKTERVSDLVKRAGGLSGEANTDGAYFARRKTGVSYQSLVDSLRTKADSASRVGIDLTAILRDPGDVDNLLLQDGDSLDVPTRRATVEIKGAVNSPTVVALAPGKSLEHYIRAGGGGSRLAQKGSAYVIQPNGKIESRHRVFFAFRSDPTPRAGATVIVPAKDSLEVKGNSLATVSAVTSLLATLLTAIAIVRK
jgi:protein involved in polysaccharide export with SLBB domain